MTQIKDVMTQNPTTCEPSTSVMEAARMMASQDVGPLPVVENSRLVGVVTDRDLVLRVLAEGRDPKATTVGEVASKDIVSVAPETTLDEALGLLARHQVRRLPVVEGERLVGIVAQADVARQGDDRETGRVVEEISKP